MRAAAVSILLLCACKDDADPSGPVAVDPSIRPRVPDTLKGTLTVGGKPATLTRCTVGHHDHVFVEVETPLGRIHFEDAKLRWTATDRSEALLDCKKLDRSWGGGNRRDGSSYFRGQLRFECSFESTAIVGDLLLDCGNITDQERTELDANRNQLLDDQKAQKSP